MTPDLGPGGLLPLLRVESGLLAGVAPPPGPVTERDLGLLRPQRVLTDHLTGPTVHRPSTLSDQPMSEPDVAEFDMIVIGSGRPRERGRERPVGRDRRARVRRRLLSREEPFARDEVGAAFEAESTSVITGVAMTELAREHVGGPVTATLADGQTLVADEILVAVGRRPATGDLGTMGLARGSPVKADDALRSVGADGASSPWLHPVGDCNGQALLTHVGKYQARIAGDVILGKDVRDDVSRDIVPRVTITDPQVWAVGLTEAQARERRFDVKTVSTETGGVAGAYHAGQRRQGNPLARRRPGLSSAPLSPGPASPRRPSRRSARSGCGCWRRTAVIPRLVMTAGAREGRGPRHA